MKKKTVIVALLVMVTSLTSCLSADGQTLHVLNEDGDIASVPINGNGASALDDLSDVEIVTPALDEALVYDGTKWVNGAVSGDGPGTTDHSALSNLDYASAGHTGFAPDSEGVTNGDTHDHAGGDGAQIDHGGLSGLGDDDHTQYLLADGTRPMTGDLDFAGFMATAMVCDKGATVPAAPTAGQWFLHTPSGRTVLLMYDGAAWQPIISLGAMTVYVDATDGTDAIDKGGAVDGGAFATVQYAVDCIPGLVGGNVIININAETYAETVTIQGKSFTGAYTITLQGVLSVIANLTSDGNGDKGATTTQPSFYEDGMTTNAYQNKILQFTSGSNDGLYRIIDSNSNDAGTRKIVLCGPTLTAQPVATNTATVYDWGTVISSLVIQGGQLSVVINDIGVSQGTTMSGYSKLVANRSSLGKITANESTLNAFCSISSSSSSDYVVWGAYFTNLYFNGSKITQSSTGIGFRLTEVTFGYLTAGSVCDGNSSGGWGVEVSGNSLCTCWCPDVYNFIRNFTVYGMRAAAGGQGYLTAYNSYSGCGTNESAAASYGYID